MDRLETEEWILNGVEEEEGEDGAAVLEGEIGTGEKVLMVSMSFAQVSESAADSRLVNRSFERIW